ncbi:MAG: beta-galactosidase trimerization domain-containing protein, partial [bacterium]
EATGRAMPVKEDWADEAWCALVRYRYRALADYTSRVRAHVRRLRPEALVAWDYELATDNPAYARDSGWGPSLTALSDVIVSIAFDRLTRPLPKWIYQAGEQASLGRASFRRPTCVVLTYSAIFGNRRHAQPPDQLTRDIVQIAAHRGAPGVALSGSFAQDDRKALPAIEQTYRALARHQGIYRGLTSAAEVALVYSPRTADWYGQSDPFHRYLAHYRGCYEALVHEHLPFDVVEHEHLIDLLPAYRLVILPNVACLSDETARAIDGFVERGGHLIATHETALYDHEGRPRPDFALRAPGRKFVKRRLMQGTYVLVKDGDLLGPAFRDTDLIGLGLERPYGGFGPFLPIVDVDEPGGEGEFIFTEGEAQIADLVLSNPVTNNVPEFSYWEGEIGTPGLTINRFGRGSAAYLPWGVGRLYHLYGVIECRRLIGRLVERALGSRSMRTDAPVSVETVLSRNETLTVLHLINSTGIESKPLLEPVPVGPITVLIRGEATSGRALIGGHPLQVTQEEGYARFVIPQVGAFEVVVLK